MGLLVDLTRLAHHCIVVPDSRSSWEGYVMAKWVNATLAVAEDCVKPTGALGPVVLNLDTCVHLRVVSYPAPCVVTVDAAGTAWRVSPLFGDEWSAELHLEQLTGVVL